MPPEPVPADPGWDEDLAWLDRDPERETWLDRAREHDDYPLEVEYADYTPLTEEELAEIREAAADELLAVSADAAAGEDRFDGVPEGELVGLLCAWDRVEAHAAARKLAVVAELDRRNPSPEDAEFTADEIANALGESRVRADELTGTAGRLDTHLPGTRAALYDGTLSLGKARIIVNATAELDETEARAAENKVLDRAGRLTPGGLRAAIALAAMEVAPNKAKKRRETGAKFARVERWAEDELAGLGPIDPWLARDLATAAAANPKSTWCVTVADEHGHAIGHGCARPEPKNHRKRTGPGPPGFTFTPASRDGRPPATAATVPGGCTPPGTGRTCWSPSTR
jgi:hypothetical protein